MQDFRKLKVWEQAHALTLKLYRATSGFPQEEKYGLTSQLRRAMSSIPANIAEGCGREGNAELRRFLFIAMGSASEAEYFLQLTHDLGYLGTVDYEDLNTQLTAVRRMLNVLIQRITTSS
ncbi:MAG: four helix bundle protein [Anaerolineae bacterium]|nr:four helix bundle protein [Anaerolineae bacterium]